jgi:hypothetical protein
VRWGYNNIRICKGDEWKAAFKTNRGLFDDDILILIKGTLHRHKLDVSKVLNKLKKNDLYLKPEKCTFHKKEVEYLGVIVGNGKVQMDPVKVKGLSKWPCPTKVKELRSFLGFEIYYKDFITDYLHIARPLHELTKKLPSDFAVGAMLSQDFKDGRHPIAYFSKSLLPAERNYQIYDKELLAIIYAVKALRHLLLGTQHKILIRSDHKNLTYFKEAKKIMPRQARWMKVLENYDFELEHIPGHMNTVADLLSRRSDLDKGVTINDSIKILPDSLFAHKMYLVDDDEIHRKILRKVHDTPSRGHPGISNTWHLIDRQYEGPRLRKFIEQYIKGCAKCQEAKPKTTLKHTPLIPFNTHVEQEPFQYVSMDLITDLPKSGKYDAILTIVDQGCSKAAKFIPCMKSIDGEGTATLYFKHLFPWFGIPKRIISDRDPRFTSHFARAVCKATGIQQNLSTAFHLHTDRQTEHMNQWVETYLHSFVNGRQDNWSALLPLAEFTHNSWKHETMKHSPHELITGNVPSEKLMPLDDSTPTVEARLKQLSKAHSDAQQMLDKCMKNKAQPRMFQVNDKVWLDACNLRLNVPSKKLAPRRYGPFPITKKVSAVVYRLRLPNHMKIHDVFHINLLTPFQQTEVYEEAFPQPPPELVEGEEEYEVEEIVSDQRHGPRHKAQYLIKRKG